MEKNKKIAMGIDFGSSYSRVATFESDTIIICHDMYGKKNIPSCVHFGKNSISIGHQAVKWARCDSVNTISYPKILLGQTLDALKITEGVQLPYLYETILTPPKINKLRTNF